jgi:hypothetical protein
MKDFIHSHKFSDLHDNHKIIYTRGITNNILMAFNFISRIKNQVILITANEDTTIDDNWANKVPNNLHLWFAQNGISDNPKIRIIPEGLQPSYDSKTGDQGYEIAVLKETILNQIENTEPKNFIYANFNIGTNPIHRLPIKNLCIELDFIDWDETVNFSTYENYNNYDSLKHFYTKISNYRAVVCPLGHGLDTHRVYETLYCGRIPITFDFKLYEKLYYRYPVIYLDDYEKLKDKNFMDNLIKEQENKIWDRNTINFSYWKNLILDERNKI